MKVKTAIIVWKELGARERILVVCGMLAIISASALMWIALWKLVSVARSV